MSEATTTTRIPEWDLSDRLRKALRESGVGVQDMAEYLEVSRHTIGNWINGHTRPRPSEVREWSRRTGVPYEWLAHGITPAECAIRDSNPKPAGLGNEGLTRAELESFRKSIGLTGVVRPGVRSKKLTR